jgi:hypothetical protein
MRVHVARRFDRVAHAVQHGTTDGFWPIHIEMSQEVGPPKTKWVAATSTTGAPR